MRGMPMRISLCFPMMFACGCGFLAHLPPIAVAARTGDVGAIARLSAAGDDLDVRSGVNGWTPLLHAIHKDRAASVDALLAAGANVNARGSGGITPLMMAAGYGNTGMVKTLLEHGADPRAQLANGENALSFAVLGISDIDRFTAAACQASTVQLLLDKAPGLRFRGPSGPMRAVTIAKIEGCPGMQELIARRGN